MGPYTFTKPERLCSKTSIDNLFKKGNRAASQFPFRILWQAVSQPSWPFPAQVMVSVPKRNFPSAVDRNRIKRQLRELYRLRKSDLYAALGKNNQQIALSITYQGKELLDHGVLKPAFDKLIARLISQVNEHRSQQV